MPVRTEPGSPPEASMSDRLPTVGVVLLAGEAAPSREALASLYSTAGMRSLGDRLADAAAGPLWDALGARVLGAVRTALEIPLATVLAEAWNRYAAFREYLEPVRYPADRISVVTLAKHTARSTFRPVVELWVGEARCGTLHIEAELAVTLESGLLTIQAGRFTELRPGKCTVQG